MEIVEQKPINEEPLVNTQERKHSKKPLVIGIFAILFLLLSFIIYLFIDDIVSEFFFVDEVKPTEMIIDNNSYSETNFQDKGKDLKSNKNVDIKSIPDEIIKSKIFLQASDNKLYSTLPLNGEKSLILDSVYSYAVSHDKSKIAYIKSYGTEGETFFYIFDVQINETKKFDDEFTTHRSIMWSPDDRYILINFGTGPEGMTIVYSAESGQNICEFRNSPIWINSKEAFIDEYKEVSNVRPWGSGYGMGIAKINIETCESKGFVSSTENENYNKEVVEGENLIVRKEYILENESWWSDGGPNSKTQYEKYNINTKEREEYPDYETIRDQKVKEIEKLFSDSVDANYITIDENKDIEGWYLVSLSTGSSIYNQEVYVVGPKNEIIYIGNDVMASWF